MSVYTCVNIYNRKTWKSQGLIAFGFFCCKGGGKMYSEISLRHKRAKIAKKIRENLLTTKRDSLLDMKLSLLKRQYAKLLETEENIEN